MKIVSLADGDPVDLKPKRPRSAVFFLLQGSRGFRLLNAGYIEHADTRGVGHELLQKLEPFHRCLELLENQAGYVSSGSRKTRDQTVSDWVTNDRYDDGNGSCHLLRCSRTGRPMGHDYIDLQSNKLIRQNWQTVELPFRPPILESHIPAFFVSQLAKALP